MSVMSNGGCAGASAVSTTGTSAGGGSRTASSPPASSADASSGGASSSKGFSVSSCWRSSCSSSVESWRRRMASWSIGVMTSRCSARGPMLIRTSIATSVPWRPGRLLKAYLQRELFAEVDLARSLVGCQLLGGARHENLAAVEDVRAVGDRERLPDVVVGDQDADALLLQPGHDP